MCARREDWLRAGVEPRLEDLIDDPIVHLVMRRDKVAMPVLLEVLARAGAQLRKPAGSPRTTTGDGSS
jgi:hypothetical protein